MASRADQRGSRKLSLALDLKTFVGNAASLGSSIYWTVDMNIDQIYRLDSRGFARPLNSMEQMLLDHAIVVDGVCREVVIALPLCSQDNQHMVRISVGQTSLRIMMANIHNYYASYITLDEVDNVVFFPEDIGRRRLELMEEQTIYGGFEIDENGVHHLLLLSETQERADSPKVSLETASADIKLSDTESCVASQPGPSSISMSKLSPRTSRQNREAQVYGAAQMAAAISDHALLSGAPRDMQRLAVDDFF